MRLMMGTCCIISEVEWRLTWKMMESAFLLLCLACTHVFFWRNQVMYFEFILRSKKCNLLDEHVQSVSLFHLPTSIGRRIVEFNPYMMESQFTAWTRLPCNGGSDDAIISQVHIYELFGFFFERRQFMNGFLRGIFDRFLPFSYMLDLRERAIFNPEWKEIGLPLSTVDSFAHDMNEMWKKFVIIRYHSCRKPEHFALDASRGKKSKPMAPVCISCKNKNLLYVICCEAWSTVTSVKQGWVQHLNNNSQFTEIPVR